MIIVGISPGVRTLAYCVLLFQQEALPEVRDMDLMKGGRVKGDADEHAINRGANPHALVLDVVLERAMEENGTFGLPTLVVVGPSANQKEPAPHDAQVRQILKNMVIAMQGLGHRIEHREWKTEAQLKRALGGDIRAIVNRAIPKATTLMRGPGYVSAIAAALAGHRSESARLLKARTAGGTKLHRFT